jgi:hypothetical protein
MLTFQDQFDLISTAIPLASATHEENEEKMGRTDDYDIELETTLQEFVLYLLGDRVETDVRRRADFFNSCGGHDSLDKGMDRCDEMDLEMHDDVDVDIGRYPHLWNKDH